MRGVWRGLKGTWGFRVFFWFMYIYRVLRGMGKCLNIYTQMFESQKSFCGSDCSRVCEERVLLMWKTLLLLLLFFFKGQKMVLLNGRTCSLEVHHFGLHFFKRGINI